MKNTYLMLIAALGIIAPAATAQAQAPAFDRAIACASGAGLSDWGPNSLVVDAAGNTYVAGRFNGTIALGNTLLTATQAAPNATAPSDNFVAKLDAAGTYLWAVQMGDNQRAIAGNLAVDGAGDVYVTGSFSGFSVRFGPGGPVLFNSSAQNEGFVAKLSGSTRQWLWARRAGGTGHDYLGPVAVNAAGEVVVAGESRSPTLDAGPFTLTAAAPPVGAFTAKLSPAGTWLWARPVANGRASLITMLLDAQGDIYLAGSFTAPSISFGSTTLTTQGVPGSPYPTTGHELFVAKTNDAGAWLWAVQADALTHVNLIGLSDMAFDGAGHLYVTGGYASTSARIGATVLPNLSGSYPNPIPLPPVPYTNHRYNDAFVARLNAGTGAWEWAVRNGGVNDESGRFIRADAQGRVYAFGAFSNAATGGRAQLAQLDGTTGTWRSYHSLPAFVWDIAFDGPGRLNLAGYFHGATATFGATVLAQAGPGRGTGYVARMGAGPLAATRGGPARGELRVWPNPAGRGPVWVQGGAPGQAVQVLDALGRVVATGRMPASGPLHLGAAGGLAPGLYVVRSGQQARRLVVE